MESHSCHSPTHSLEAFPLTLMSADSEFDVPTAGQSETVLVPLPTNHLYTSRGRRRRRRCCWCCSLLPRGVARCAGEGGEDGANGGWKRFGSPGGLSARAGSGHDKMFPWDAGCQRWLFAGTRRHQGFVDERREWHQKQLRLTVLQYAGRRGANSSGLSLDSEDEQGSQLEDERSSQSQSCSMSVSGIIDIHFCQKIQHWCNFKKRFLKALLRKTTPSGDVTRAAPRASMTHRARAAAA